jgi:hypothetical protein
MGVRALRAFDWSQPRSIRSGRRLSRASSHLAAGRTFTAALMMAATSVTACASAATAVNVVSQASGSPYFSLGPPAVYKGAEGLTISGRVCRRDGSTLLSPPRVRLEHLAPTGARIGVARARVPEIYREVDQRCADYTTRVVWAIGPGDGVRACFDGGRACPS